KIRERLGVHEPVLDRDIQQRVERRAGGFRGELARRGAQCGVNRFPQLRVVRLNFRDARPVRRLIARQLSVYWIDSECEQFVECWMCARDSKRVAPQQIPIERFQMSKVKNQPVPLGNRPIVNRIRTQQRKQQIRLRARLLHALLQRVKGIHRWFGSGHGRIPGGQKLPFYSFAAGSTTILDSNCQRRILQDLRYLLRLSENVRGREIPSRSPQGERSASNLRNALPRWLTSFFSASRNSANVFERGGK